MNMPSLQQLQEVMVSYFYPKQAFCEICTFPERLKLLEPLCTLTKWNQSGSCSRQTLKRIKRKVHLFLLSCRYNRDLGLEQATVSFF